MLSQHQRQHCAYGTSFQSRDRSRHFNNASSFLSLPHTHINQIDLFNSPNYLYNYCYYSYNYSYHQITLWLMYMKPWSYLLFPISLNKTLQPCQLQKYNHSHTHTHTQKFIPPILENATGATAFDHDANPFLKQMRECMEYLIIFRKYHLAFTVSRPFYSQKPPQSNVGLPSWLCMQQLRITLQHCHT